MREVLLGLQETGHGAPVHSIIASIGSVYDKEGEVFNPLEPRRDSSAYEDRPTADFIVQADSQQYVFRPWFGLTVRDRDIWGIVVSANDTASVGEPVYSMIHKSVVEPLVIGQEGVLAGLRLGVINRIVKQEEIRVLPRTPEVNSLETARRHLGLMEVPFFLTVDKLLSEALGEETSAYELTAKIMKDRDS